ncbi:MAG: hypothetical protein LBE78_09195 [Burkholderiaceae bacterium]|jgi:hypothetical protein|nr:hypothetical protein [Burkholderiaceae bacterium]
MKKALAIAAGTSVIISAVLYFTIGVERIVGDHEIGVSWEPFIKHRLSMQIRFTNPAQKGLELIPFEELSSSEQDAFMNFCDIRFGVNDTARCYDLISKRKI